MTPVVGKHNAQSSVFYWANGLNIVGYIFLALTFVFAFAPKITTALPLFFSLVLACAMFVASAFVKIFKSEEWEQYCWGNKKEATFFSILNLFAASCFIILFLLTGGFGLFHIAFSAAIPAMTKHLVIGSVTFLAVGAITLLLSGISSIFAVKGVFAKSVDESTDENDIAFSSFAQQRQRRENAPQITYARCRDDNAMAERVNGVTDSAIAKVKFTKQATDLTPNEFASVEDAEKFFVSVIKHYFDKEKYPENVNLNAEERNYVRDIAALVKSRKDAYHILDAVSSARSFSSHL
ncbi:MAG: hypothetical protein M1561_04160 [Gammaproteobacteria bacterium]|nr:hypothetical protein [Gammaproteobacteria bacterium]